MPCAEAGLPAQGGPAGLEGLLPPGAFYELTAPAEEGPRRWFIPMENPHLRWSGISLYTPTSWKGRVYRAAIRAWISAGGPALTGRGFVRSGTDWRLGELLRPVVPELASAALYVRPGADTKVVVQLMGPKGEVLGYAKYAEKAEPRALMMREATLLGILPPDVGPRLILATPFLDGELTVQTTVPGRTRALRSRLALSAHQRLLTRLVRPAETHPSSSHPFLMGLLERSPEHRPHVERVVCELAGRDWPVAYMHGDLSTWNMRYWHGDLRALDWEYGREAGMAYAEAPHALITVAGTIKQVEPPRAKRVITSVLRSDILPGPYQAYARPIATLAALNMLISWNRVPTEVDQFATWLAAFVAADA